MMVTGGVICLIYYTEITPPNFDTNYHRYVGSSMPRIVGKSSTIKSRLSLLDFYNINASLPIRTSSSGPLLVAFGGLLSVGDLLVIGVTVQQYTKKSKPVEPIEMSS